ncbi:3813_t:CDS:1, partial [Dentiscutata erythropus]
MDLNDTKRTSLIKTSNDDISLSKTNISSNENLLDDATIGHILNMLDQSQDSESLDNLFEIPSKLNYGYDYAENVEDCSQDFIVNNNDDKSSTPRRTKSSLSRKRSIRQKSLDNSLSRTSTMNSNSFSEISEEDLKESGTDTTGCSLNPTKRTKSVKSLRKSFKNSNQNKNNLTDDNNKTCDERNDGTIDESKKDVNDRNSGYSNFYLAMPNGQWRVRTRTASRKIT